MDINISSSQPYEAGIYTWHLPSQLVYGDTAFATLYGFEPERAFSGLPISELFKRIHREDRPAVISSTEMSLSEPRPFFADYRIVQPTGGVFRATTSGRSFGTTGDVVYCAGIVFPSEVVATSLHDLVLAACSRAQTDGQDEVAEKLRRIMQTLVN